MNTLSDMREIEVGFSSLGIRKMIGVMVDDADRRADAKAAIVVNSRVAFGMGRMVELSAEHQTDPRFRIFRDLDEAKRWLGVD